MSPPAPTPPIVIPAKAGTQQASVRERRDSSACADAHGLDPRFRGDDNKGQGVP